MTREEVIEIFEQKGWWIAQKETLTSKQAEEIIKLNDAVDFALSALRPVSREQVEKVWRGEWVKRHKHRGGAFDALRALMTWANNMRLRLTRGASMTTFTVQSAESKARTTS